TAGELAAKKAELRRRPFIQVRDFIVGESDVDILSDRGHLGLDASDYGIKKVDSINAERLDPITEAGKSEREQGHIPVEKIVLGRTGIESSPLFGDGAKEIFTGKLTVHFAPRAQFDNTQYAKLG